MIIKSCFNLVDIANEFMLVPLEDAIKSFRGIVVLNDAAGFLMQQMKTPKTKDELVESLMKEYNVDQTTAEIDVDCFLEKMLGFGVIED